MKHTFSAENDIEGEFNVEVSYYVEREGRDYDVVILSAYRENGDIYPLGDAERDEWEHYLAEILTSADLAPVPYDKAAHSDA